MRIELADNDDGAAGLAKKKMKGFVIRKITHQHHVSLAQSSLDDVDDDD